MLRMALCFRKKSLKNFVYLCENCKIFKLHVLFVSLHILNHCVNFNKTWHKAFLDNWNWNPPPRNPRGQYQS